jgi:hypothetical protein
MTLERAAVFGGPEFLNGHFGPVLGYTKAAQRVLHQAERQLALALLRHLERRNRPPRHHKVIACRYR